jgi:hypothetical protein
MRFKPRGILLALVAVLTMSALTAASALAAGKPLVETKPATAITKSEATLNGVVNPNGAETTYHFEYGPTTAYGTNTPEVYVGSGTSNVEELQKLAGLLADKGYDFRIVAKNTNGTTDGANEAFTTSGPKVPLAETVGASAITEGRATLNGVVNPNGVETKYYFEYGTTISYGKKTAETSAGAGSANLNENATITGLTAKTTYHYRVVATNANGTTDGGDGTFYTKVGPEFKPVPTKKKFTASGVGYTWGSSGLSITCTGSSLAGEITGAQTVGKVVITWSGCKGTVGEQKWPVNSEGAKAGEIVTMPLTGELGTVAKGEAETSVGLRLKAESKKNWFVLEEGEIDKSSTAYSGDLAVEFDGLGKEADHGLFFQTGAEGMKIKEITMDSGVVEKPKLEAGAKVVSIEADYPLTFEELVEVT